MGNIPNRFTPPVHSLTRNCTDDVTWEVVTKLAPRALRLNKTYVKIYICWMSFFLNLLVPLSVMFILNVVVYRELKKLWAIPLTYCTHERCIQLNQRRHTLLTSCHGKSQPMYEVRTRLSNNNNNNNNNNIPTMVTSGLLNHSSNLFYR